MSISLNESKVQLAVKIVATMLQKLHQNGEFDQLSKILHEGVDSELLYNIAEEALNEINTIEKEVNNNIEESKAECSSNNVGKVYACFSNGNFFTESYRNDERLYEVGSSHNGKGFLRENFKPCRNISKLDLKTGDVVYSCVGNQHTKFIVK